MEDFYINISSQDAGYNYSNISSLADSSDDYDIYQFIIDVVVICISLPLTLVAIYALYSQIRKDHVAPIYVINLLMSDLIQLCCLIVWVAPTLSDFIDAIIHLIYFYSLMVSIGFMVCIALERYLVIAHPLWYRFRRTIKISVGVCVLVWILPFVFFLIFIFWVHFGIIIGLFFLLPLPLFIFFLGGTLKSLSATRVPSDERRRIVAVLVLVLLIYTLMFLPAIIFFLSKGDTRNITVMNLSDNFIQLSPLADLTLYIFMRKGTVDKLLSSVCCCRMDSDDTNSSSV